MLKSENVDLQFTDGAIKEIAKVAFEVCKLEKTYMNVFEDMKTRKAYLL